MATLDHLPATSPAFAAFAAYLPRTRWFGAKPRAFSVEEVARIGTCGDSPLVENLRVRLRFDDGEVADFQVPLAYYRHPQEHLDVGLVGTWHHPEHGIVHGYDAVYDSAAMAHFLTAFAGGPVSGMAFRRTAHAPASLSGTASLFPGEQSNSTVLFGDDVALKLYRTLSPGPNPDITTHAALTEAGSPHVAPLYGWLETDEPTPTHLGMLQQFVREASDGWELATTSAATDGDFTMAARQLGEATAAVHAALREHLPSAESSRSLTDVAAQMHAHLDDVLAAVGELRAHEPALRAIFDAVRGTDHGADVPVQRLHGDLHLGQTLRTPHGWKLLDFEGEPARAWDQRVRPDVVWRDVAGMLRSFDYAARVGAKEAATHWTRRTQEAFVEGYVGGPPTAEHTRLIRAYEADKAVYEVMYEARNRPEWIAIPLAGIAAMTSGPADRQVGHE